MRFNKASLWLSVMMVTGGCGKDPELTTITVACEPASVVAGQPSQCTASATDQEGKPFAISGYRWTSNNESVATVDSTTGKASTRTAGTATIIASATADGVTKQGQATLTATQPQPQSTLHTNAITANETWRAAGNPHIVRGSIEVGGASAPTLTLEEGVEIRFEQDAEFRVTGGALRAMGTAQAPIHMVANQSTPTKGYWRGVVLAAEGSASEMNHVTLSDCGSSTGESACVAVKSKAMPVLRHVTVQNSGTTGVTVADDGSAFGTGSTTLSVSGSTGYAVRIGANQAGTLPAGGAFTGNAPDAVEVRGNVSSTQTWKNPGIPYVVNDEVYVQGDTGPTLTLAAGTTLRFGSNFGLFVGDTSPGELIVGGTVDMPVLLTADSASPTPGHWKGVFLMSRTTSTSRISHTTIEYGGGGSSTFYAGTLNVYGELGGGSPNPIIDNVVVQKSKWQGVSLWDNGSFGPGSTKLTARENGRYAISISPNSVASIPTDSTFSGNAKDGVEIRGLSLSTSQTWPKLGMPYVINETFYIGSASTTTLTLPAGTKLRFDRGSSIWVGTSGEPGVLSAVGTETEPIEFLPNAPLPTSSGYWGGLHFQFAEGSRLDYVAVGYAGQKVGFGTGNVNVYREIGAFMTNSTIYRSSGCGVIVSDGTKYSNTNLVTTVFNQAEYLNAFLNNDGGVQCTY